MRFDPKSLLNRRAVADGAWSTELRSRGVAHGRPAEAANVDQPDLVEQLARDYVDAGARFLTTNTFAANRFNAARFGNADVGDVNRKGAEIARRAAEGADVVVLGSIGPSGKILAVRESDSQRVSESFADQAAALVEGGVDGIILETFSELAEVVQAVQAVRRICKLPLIASLSFDSGPQRTKTMMGVAAAEAVAALEQAGADMIGSNCGVGVAQALPAVVALRAACALPLWVKPNAGLPELEQGRAVYRQTPEEFASFVPTLFEAGANVVGGCCGSGPAHIRRVAALLG
jgi:methionine synthase I (cobalamin-dependent)